MCRSLNLYMKYIYAEYFMVYLLRVRSSGWSLRIILQHGGGGARRMRPLAPPPPCWRLILLDTQAQQYGGEGGARWRKRGVEGGSDPVIQSHASGSSSGRLSLLPLFFFSLVMFFILHSSFTTLEGRTPTPTCCSSSLTKGTISELTWVSNSWLFFFLSSQAANWYVSHVKSPSQLRAGGRA